MINAPLKKSCGCGCSGNKRAPARLGDTASDQTFMQWLQQQPADTQSAYYSSQAANPGDPIGVAPGMPPVSNTISPTLQNVGIAIGFTLGTVLLLNLLSGSSGGRRR